MNWEDEGFILSKRKFRENAIILEVFTNNLVKLVALFMAAHPEGKNYLQLSNKI